MKRNLFASILAGVAVGVAVFVSTSKPSLAETTTFYCGTSSDGVPTMFARHPIRGEAAFIRWEKTDSSVSDLYPKLHCQIVSERFERASATGILKTLTYEFKNGYPVICVASEPGGFCVYNLLTLNPNQDPRKFIKFLGDINSSLTTKNAPQIQTSQTLLYLDMNQLLNTPESSEIHRFFCGTFESIPATMVNTSPIHFPLIVWSRDYYFESEEERLTKCLRVSGILNNYSRIGILNYLSTGTMEGSQVICVVAEVGQPCNRLLFKLKPSENGEEVLQGLKRRIDELSGSALER